MGCILTSCFLGDDGSEKLRNNENGKIDNDRNRDVIASLPAISSSSAAALPTPMRNFTNDNRVGNNKQDDLNIEYLDKSIIQPNNANVLLDTSYGFCEARAVAQNFTIDTSRAKTNKQVVSICATKLGLLEYPEGRDDGAACDIYWHNIVYHDMRTLVKSPHAKVNKFPGMSDLSKKIPLTRAISSMRHLFPNEYQFYPSSWFIPAQFDAFVEHCNGYEAQHGSSSHDAWYIVKPDDGAQGTGIYLIQKPDQIKEPEARQLIQEYVADPYLMSDGLKFDFRVYAVIKSINPLSIYAAREGMVRFCTEKYEKPTASNFENLYAHLTNYSLNKENNAYIHSLSLRDQSRGSKRLLTTVFHQMESRGVKTKYLWHSIKLIIVKTMIAMLPEIMLSYEHYFYDTPGPQCFQIMGFDILVTKDLQPVLLEVNSAPSLTIEHCLSNPLDEEKENTELLKVRSVVDEVIKIPLVRDTILLVLNLIDDVYTARSVSCPYIPESRNANKEVQKATDDMEELKAKRKCHLTEIFPCRYGHSSGHLLFLDKVVYLFMQFVNLKQTTVMTISGVHTFLKKCNLHDAISVEEVESKYIEIYKYFTVAEYIPYVSGLSFHGFLYLLYHIAHLKYPHFENLLEQMQHLLSYCDTSLRHYGVRSTRLRRAQIDRENSKNVEIYLLPSRILNKREGRLETRPKATTLPKFRARYGRSLPRNLNGVISKEPPVKDVNYNNKRDDFVLPKIHHPFHL